MAAPHISGLAALLIEAFPTATTKKVEAAIVASSKRPVSVPEARGGFGIPDASEAFEILNVTSKTAASRGKTGRK